eukprot:6203058-Pleurochrysis_carterae.AAC.2
MLRTHLLCWTRTSTRKRRMRASTGPMCTSTKTYIGARTNTCMSESMFRAIAWTRARRYGVAYTRTRTRNPPLDPCREARTHAHFLTCALYTDDHAREGMHAEPQTRAGRCTWADTRARAYVRASLHVRALVYAHRWGGGRRWSAHEREAQTRHARKQADGSL